MTAREALEYVAYVETHDCNGGTGNSLQLQFDPTTWNSYALAAVRTANFLSKMITSNNNNVSTLSEQVLYSLVTNNVHLKSVIFGSAIALEPDPSLPYPLMCPYAYKETDNSSIVSVHAKDLSVSYNYTDPQTEWYHTLRFQNYDNLSIVTDQIQLRTGNSLDPASDVTQPVAFLEDGHWTNPYYDCGGGDIWMVTYSSPFFGLSPDHKSVIFRGVATIDIELTNIDVNQCDPDLGSSGGALDVFRGTHNCQHTTVCVFTPGKGFTRGAYHCECAPGYFFPDVHASNKYYNGSEIEAYMTLNNMSYITSYNRYRCNQCAPGCVTCTTAAPCLFTRNLYIKAVVLALTIITIVVIVIVSVLIFHLRESKIIKSGSPIFLLLMCAGSALMCLQLFVMFPDADDRLCMVMPWPYHLGFVLLYGSLLLKTWRISVIFRQGQIKRIQLPDKTLIRRFVPIIAITVAYLVAWTSANRNTTQTRETNAGLKFTMCTENWWSYSAYGIEVLMLLFGVYLCFTVRKAPASFNESKHITWSIYNAIILSTFVLIIVQFVAETSGPDLMYILYFLNCQVVVTITMVLILAPKFYAVHMKLEVRRRDSLPTISGMNVQPIKRQYRSVGVQTTSTGEDNDNISNNATWLPFRKRSKVRPIEAPSSNKYEATMTIDSIKST